MEINGHHIDIDNAIHSVALEIAKIDLQSRLGNDLNIKENPLECADAMYESYLRIFGYLSLKSDEYIKVLTGNN